MTRPLARQMGVHGDDDGWAGPGAVGAQAAQDAVGAVVSRRPCSSCGAPLAFVRTASGKLAPMEVDGQGVPTETNHFQTCPDAGRFARSTHKGTWPKRRQPAGPQP